jgi:copper homeostasis protein CutC
MEDYQSQVIPVTLEDGTVIRVEARDLGGSQKVGAFDSKAFTQLTDSIEAIAITFRRSLAKIQPRKATVEFGIEVGIESGQLTALICKGSGKANIKVSLEWSELADTGAAVSGT